MNGKQFRKAMCVILALMMFGCRSAYDLTLYSKPSGVIVELGPDIQGRTPCNLKIPRKSEIIQDHHINVKYILQDGREIVKSYDLRNYEPPKTDIGGFIGGCIIFPGVLLLKLVSSDKKDDEEENRFYKPYDEEEEKEKEKERKEKNKVGLIGLGLIVLGVLTFNIFGKHDDKRQYKYDIHETFEEAAALTGD